MSMTLSRDGVHTELRSVVPIPNTPCRVGAAPCACPRPCVGVCTSYRVAFSCANPKHALPRRGCALCLPTTLRRRVYLIPSCVQLCQSQTRLAVAADLASACVQYCTFERKLVSEAV